MSSAPKPLSNAPKKNEELQADELNKVTGGITFV